MLTSEERAYTLVTSARSSRKCAGAPVVHRTCSQERAPPIKLTRSGRFVRANGNGNGKHAPLGVAVVGYGYWGPNLVRNVVERPELALSALCERDPLRAAGFAQRIPGVPVLADLEAALLHPDVDAVIVATPPRTHHAIVKQALEAGKHVLVEKPLATRGEDAEELVNLAEERGLVLMPGHTFVYSPAVNKVRELIEEGALGDIYFVTSSRMNLGKYQSDGVICDLAPHDLSILLHWLQRPITQIATSARSVFQEDVPETAFLSLQFEGGTAANVQISWLAPRKMRQMVVVGSKRMVVYDDTASDEAIRVYDRGMDFTTPETFGEYQLTYRSGDMLVPAHRRVRAARARAGGLRPRHPQRRGAQLARAAGARDRARDRRRRRVPAPRRRAGLAGRRQRPDAPPSMAAAVATAGVERPGVEPAGSGRRPLRICMVHYSDFHVDSRIQRQARALAERGDEVDLVCLSPDAELTRRRGAHPHPRGPGRQGRRRRAPPTCAATRRFFARALWTVSRLERRRRYDVVEAHNMPDFLTATAALPKLRGAAVILNVHDTFPELYATKFGVGAEHPLVRGLRFEEAASARLADAVITVTDRAQRGPRRARRRRRVTPRS